MLTHVKMQTIVDILTFISMINTSERLKARKVFILKHFSFWFRLYFICILYDKYTSNTESDYNTTTIQMGFRRKSNDLFESVSQEFTVLLYVLSCRNCHLCRE